MLSRCLEDESGTGDHGGEAHTGLDVGGSAGEHDQSRGSRSVLGHGGGGRAVGAVAGSDGLGVAGRDSGGHGSAGSADLLNNDGTSGARSGVNLSADGNHVATGGRVDSGGGNGVRAASASNGSNRQGGLSGADVGGRGDRDDLSDDCVLAVLERAVGDGRSARRDGDNVGRVDGRGCDTAGRDGGHAVAVTAIATVVASAGSDALGELDTSGIVSSLNIAVKGAGTSVGVKGSTDTGGSGIAKVHAVIKAGRNSTSGDVDLDVDDGTEVVGVALDSEGGTAVVDVERKVEARAELAVKGRGGGVGAGAAGNSGGSAVGTGAARDGRGHGAARGNGGGGGVAEVVLGDGRGHASEGQDGSGGDGAEGRHFDCWFWWWWIR
jgi:hypothetical protein